MLIASLPTFDKLKSVRGEVESVNRGATTIPLGSAVAHVVLARPHLYQATGDEGATRQDRISRDVEIAKASNGQEGIYALAVEALVEG
jgi:hypothetical protein